VRRLELALAGAGGEAVDFRATIASHGLGWLAPNRLELAGATCALETTLDLGADEGRFVRLTCESAGRLAIDIAGPRLASGSRDAVIRQVRAMLALDLDLSAFHTRAARDPKLAWTARGVGRMLRSPSAFEDVARTLCTTNCTWGGTTRMIAALVAELGTPARGAPGRRAFPGASAIAECDDRVLRDVARMGYRAPFLRAIAREVANGALDLEALRDAPPEALPDAELDARLRALPGFGPYAAAHTMMLFGRRSRLVLDSWTRPTYARLVRRKHVADDVIERRFRKTYGEDAGLAFWLFLWRERHESEAPPSLA